MLAISRKYTYSVLQIFINRAVKQYEHCNQTYQSSPTINQQHDLMSRIFINFFITLDINYSLKSSPLLNYSNFAVLFEGKIHCPSSVLFPSPTLYLIKTFHVFPNIEREVTTSIQPQTEGILLPKQFKYFNSYYYITSIHQKLTFTYFF